MVRKLVLAVAAASALMSSNMVQALGVGEINLRSALNQPLEAEIELLQVRDLGSAEIRSVLASPDDFGRAGVDRSFFLTDLTFTPVVRPDGKAYIRVTSTRPVKEPYLNFLMEVRWPSGRVLREFTLLLDPPLYDPTPVTFSAPVTPPATAASGVVRTPAPAAAPAPTPSTAATPAPSAAPARTPAADGQRRTTRSDTLWGIALETRPTGSSVHQTMLAIQDLNPNAFIGNNINTLKAGQTLTLPNAEQAAVRSRAEAVAEVSSQTAAWQNRQPASEPAQRQLDARERSVASGAPSQTQGEDSLRLVAGSADSSDESVSSSGGQDNGLRDTLDQTKEQLDSAEQAKNELTDRLADVEGQLETLQRLLTLKDAQLAALQRELADDGALPDILPVPEDGVATETEGEILDDEALAELAGITPSEGVVETDQPVEQQTEPTELDALAQVESETEEGGQDSTGNDEEQVALAPAATPGEQSATGPDNGSASPAAPDTPEPSDTLIAPEAQLESAENSSPEALLQRFMQNQALLLGTGAVALLVLLLILMSIARRNARREEELADNYMAASAARVGSAPEEEGDDFNVALADAQDETEQGVAPDPLAEADELISYDELNEAAELLEDAIDQEPERADLRLKMMEVEAKLENQQGYAIQVEALKSMGVADSSVELMNARYPLMAAGLVTGAALMDAQLDTVAETSQSDAQELEQPLLDEQELQDTALTEDDTADFDFADFGLEEDTAASLADASEQEVGFDLDFDLDEGETDLSAPAAAQTTDLPEDAPVFDELLLDSTPSATEDTELDLGLDDELQAENLLAEFEAMSSVGESELQSDTDTLRAAGDGSFSLSDEDLAGFEAQLQTEIQAESSAGALGDASEQPGDIAGSDNTGTASEDLMIDGLDEDFDFLSDTDECATKLDLARAYIDMGDEEGARDILAEVVDEGNEQQQQDAREMMGQLG